jgi:hypothetical protein
MVAAKSGNLEVRTSLFEAINSARCRQGRHTVAAGSCGMSLLVMGAIVMLNACWGGGCRCASLISNCVLGRCRALLV